MRSIFLVATAAPLILASRGHAQTRAFVQTIGNDTISLEQYTRVGDTVTGTWLTTYGGMTVHDYVIVLRADGSVEHTRVSVRRVSGQQLGDIDISFDRDSATVVTRADSVTRRRIAAPGAFPILGQTAGMWEMITRHQRAEKQDSAVVPVMVAFGGQVGRASVVIRDDSARFTAWRFSIDRDGGIQAGTGRLSATASRTVRQVSTVDLAAALKHFPDIPADVPLEQASYIRRDTAAAEVGGARLTIDYSRPYTSGRKVFAHGILGDTLWRTGTYAATQLTTTADIVISGKTLPAGTYTLWTRASPDNSSYQLVLNRQVGQWGTEHDFSRDVLAVPLRATTLAAPVDPFTISIDSDGATAVIRLRWAAVELSAPISGPPA